MRLISGKSFYNKPWYNNYRAMMSRCYRTKDQSYKYYGGRGIRVCDEWHNIEAFEAWEHDNPFFVGATIDRIDTNADYSPSNCRWATYYEQANNQTTTLQIEYDGRKMPLSYWAKSVGINKHTLYDRMFRYGWSVEKAFNTPVRRHK